MRPTLVIDTQLAVLLIVGNADRAYVESHKRLSGYVLADYDLLLRTVDRFRGLICSVNVLTETSNLTRQVAEPRRSQISTAFQRFLATCEEIYCPSIQVAQSTAFRRLGLTDAGLLTLLGGDTVFLTADLPLYLEAMRQGLSAINFAHLRENEMGV